MHPGVAGVITPLNASRQLVRLDVPIMIGVSGVAWLLSLPIPVPFADMIPALGRIHLAAGQGQRDGLAVLIGHVFALGAYLYMFFIWDTALAVLREVTTW